jgi:hypothetical protein
VAAEARLSAALSTAIKKYQYRKFFAFRIESSHTCPGVPDWLFLFGPSKYLFLELKAANGSLTKAQKIVLPLMDKLGVPVKVLTKTKQGCMITNVGRKDGTSYASVNDFVEALVKEYGNE